MLSLIFTVIKWFVSSVINVIKFILMIPTYLTYFTQGYGYMPAPLATAFIICLSVFVIIKIKRLIL